MKEPLDAKSAWEADRDRAYKQRSAVLSYIKMSESPPSAFEDARDSPAIAMFWIFAAVFGVIALLVFAPMPTGPALRAAHDKAQLECRQSGGSFEDFRTLGYVCVPDQGKPR